jgi:hypothetical protein
MSPVISEVPKVKILVIAPDEDHFSAGQLAQNFCGFRGGVLFWNRFKRIEKIPYQGHHIWFMHSHSLSKFVVESFASMDVRCCENFNDVAHTDTTTRVALSRMSAQRN